MLLRICYFVIAETGLSAMAFATNFIEAHWLALKNTSDANRAQSWQTAITDHCLRVPGFPVEYGGRHWPDTALCHWWALCAEHGCPMPDPVATELVGPLMMLAPNPKQYRAHLQAIASGEAAWELVCLDPPNNRLRRLKTSDHPDWVLLIQNQERGTARLEILRPWTGLDQNLSPTADDFKTSTVLSLDASAMLLTLQRDHQPIAAIWRNRELLRTLRAEASEDPTARENQRLCELEILQTAQEILCLRLIQIGAREKRLVVTQTAREIRMKSLQLKHEQLGYYALTEATPPGQNERQGSIKMPTDAHFMIESVNLVSDFFINQIEINAEQDTTGA